MSYVQILTIAVALGTSFLAVLTGVLLNNTRLNDVKEVLRAEMSGGFGEIRLLMEKNHSEMMAKFVDLDGRFSRIEGERRIVQ